MDAFDRRAARRLREIRRQRDRETCSHAIGPTPCARCGARVCLICQSEHVCKGSSNG